MRPDRIRCTDEVDWSWPYIFEDSRAPAFRDLLALSGTADEAIARPTSLLPYQVHHARAPGEPIPK
jgi:hypothetical protein